MSEYKVRTKGILQFTYIKTFLDNRTVNRIMCAKEFILFLLIYIEVECE